jgi:hypothetical protein
MNQVPKIKFPSFELVNNVAGMKHMLILLTTLESNTTQKLIEYGHQYEVWNYMKKCVIYQSPIDMIRDCLLQLSNQFDIKDTFEKITEKILSELFNNDSENLKNILKNEICDIKKAEKICEFLYENQYVIDRLNTKKILFNLEPLISSSDMIQKILNILKKDTLTKQVENEQSLMWKSTILWNFVKFNYSDSFNEGLKLNDDVISIVKSFIPLSVKLQHLRVSYSNQYLIEGLMKKNKKQLTKLTYKINCFYLQNFWMLKTRFISSSCNKTDLVNKIVDTFTKMEKISYGEKFELKFINEGKYGRIFKDKQPKYSKQVYDLLLLLVTIIKMPKIKIVRNNSKTTII